jgi:hypothetical protein
MHVLSLAEDRDDRPHEDHFVVLGGVSWADYQRLLEVRGDRSAPRLTCLEGRVSADRRPAPPCATIATRSRRGVEKS